MTGVFYESDDVGRPRDGYATKGWTQDYKKGSTGKGEEEKKNAIRTSLITVAHDGPAEYFQPSFPQATLEVNRQHLNMHRDLCSCATCADNDDE